MTIKYNVQRVLNNLDKSLAKLVRYLENTKQQKKAARTTSYHMAARLCTSVVNLLPGLFSLSVSELSTKVNKPALHLEQYYQVMHELVESPSSSPAARDLFKNLVFLALCLYINPVINELYPSIVFVWPVLIPRLKYLQSAPPPYITNSLFSSVLRSPSNLWVQSLILNEITPKKLHRQYSSQHAGLVADLVLRKNDFTAISMLLEVFGKYNTQNRKLFEKHIVSSLHKHAVAGQSIRFPSNTSAGHTETWSFITSYSPNFANFFQLDQVEFSEPELSCNPPTNCFVQCCYETSALIVWRLHSGNVKPKDTLTLINLNNVTRWSWANHSTIELELNKNPDKAGFSVLHNSMDKVYNVSMKLTLKCPDSIPQFVSGLNAMIGEASQGAHAFSFDSKSRSDNTINTKISISSPNPGRELVNVVEISEQSMNPPRETNNNPESTNTSTRDKSGLVQVPCSDNTLSSWPKNAPPSSVEEIVTSSLKPQSHKSVASSPSHSTLLGRRPQTPLPIRMDDLPLYLLDSSPKLRASHLPRNTSAAPHSPSRDSSSLEPNRPHVTGEMSSSLKLAIFQPTKRDYRNKSLRRFAHYKERDLWSIMSTPNSSDHFAKKEQTSLTKLVPNKRQKPSENSTGKVLKRSLQSSLDPSEDIEIEDSQDSGHLLVATKHIYVNSRSDSDPIESSEKDALETILPKNKSKYFANKVRPNEVDLSAIQMRRSLRLAAENANVEGNEMLSKVQQQSTSSEVPKEMVIDFSSKRLGPNNESSQAANVGCSNLPQQHNLHNVNDDATALKVFDKALEDSMPPIKAPLRLSTRKRLLIESDLDVENDKSPRSTCTTAKSSSEKKSIAIEKSNLDQQHSSSRTSQVASVQANGHEDRDVTDTLDEKSTNSNSRLSPKCEFTRLDLVSDFQSPRARDSTSSPTSSLGVMKFVESPISNHQRRVVQSPPNMSPLFHSSLGLQPKGYELADPTSVSNVIHDALADFDKNLVNGLRNRECLLKEAFQEYESSHIQHMKATKIKLEEAYKAVTNESRVEFERISSELKRRVGRINDELYDAISVGAKDSG